MKAQNLDKTEEWLGTMRSLSGPVSQQCGKTDMVGDTRSRSLSLALLNPFKHCEIREVFLSGFCVGAKESVAFCGCRYSLDRTACSSSNAVLMTSRWTWSSQSDRKGRVGVDGGEKIGKREKVRIW